MSAAQAKAAALTRMQIPRPAASRASTGSAVWPSGRRAPDKIELVRDIDELA
jgi:hypothetical protein